MDIIQKSLDELFKQLPRNAAAKRIKAEMLENLTQRYEELAGECGPEEAQRQVIAEIGSAEEIREAIILGSPKKGWTATIIQCAIVVLCIGFLFYFSFISDYLRRSFVLWPVWIYYAVARPLLFFFGTWLVLKIINHFAQPKGIHIKNNLLRYIFLFAGIAFLAFYLFIIINMFTAILFLPLPLANFFWSNSYTVGMASVLIYLGSKK